MALENPSLTGHRVMGRLLLTTVAGSLKDRLIGAEPLQV
jgi:hypothetical protein